MLPLIMQKMSKTASKFIRQGVVDTGRSTAGTGLVTLGFYAYNQVNPEQLENREERDEAKIIISP